MFLIVRVYAILQMFLLQFMIENRQPDVSKVSTKFYECSVSRNLFSRAEMRQFGAARVDGLNSIKMPGAI